MNQSFEITPRVIAHLGEDLIKNESIALVELVKNSYDAGATSCDVEFSFIGETLVKIIVADNGSGMDMQTVQNSWLVIGTDNKKKQLERGSTGRLPLGEKGIGRLGVHKLGNKIHLESKRDKCKLVEVDINWTLLDKAEKVDDFPVTVKEINNLKNEEEYKVLFRAKPKLFAHILQCFSSHAARLGLGNIKVG